MKILATSIIAFFGGTFGLNAMLHWAGQLPEINFELPADKVEECRVEKAKGIAYTVWEYRDPLRGWLSTPAVNGCMVDYLVTEAQLRGHRTMVTRPVGFAFMETGEEYLLETKKGK